MPTHYNLRTFLQRLSRDLLVELFTFHGIARGLEFRKLKKRDVEPIFATITRLPEEQHRKLDSDFQNIHVLATEAGLKHIIDEARFLHIDIIEKLRPLKRVLDKVAWMYLHEPSIFEVASRLAVRDTLPGLYWKRRLPLTAAPGVDLSATAKTLETAVSDYFMNEEGRGKACHVDYVNRDALHHFFTYPEDYPASPLAWTAKGLGTHTYRPAFEVVFVFDDTQGCLDIYCSGDRQAIERLRGIFAKAVLDIPELPDLRKPAYNLEGLKSRHFQFVRPPESPIVDVRVKKLGFAVMGRNTKIGIETDPSEDRNAIHAEVERVFTMGPAQLGRIALSQVEVVSATLTAAIDPRDGTRSRVRTFNLTTKSCALKYEGNDLLLRKMLTDSGIDVIGRGNAPNAKPKRPAA